MTNLPTFCRKAWTGAQEAAVLALCLSTGLVLPLTLVSLGFQMA